MGKCLSTALPAFMCFHHTLLRCNGNLLAKANLGTLCFMQKPVIAYTRPTVANRPAGPCIALAIRLAGGVPLKLTPADTWQQAAFDGLILSGGTDVHPNRYGQPPKQNYGYDEPRDAMETVLYNKALQQGKPVLGICRGAQLINVLHGGTLHTDVRKVYAEKHYPTRFWGQVFYRKLVCVKRGSLLFGLLGEEYVWVNSLHTQAVNKLGKGLRIVAQETGGSVQAIADPSRRFVLGVQFHPEYLLYRAKIRYIFKGLVAQAAVGKEHLK